MTYIPNVTEIFKENPYKKDAKPELNDYYEGFLNEDGALVLAGYDCAYQDMGNAFLTLDDAEGFEYTNFDISKIDMKKLQKFLEVDSDYDPFYDGDADELSKLSNETKIAMLFFYHIYRNIVGSRNEFGVSLMESMDDDEYNNLKKAYFEDGYRNTIERRKLNRCNTDELGGYTECFNVAKVLYEKEKEEEKKGNVSDET